jgi:hypothetical protein
MGRIGQVFVASLSVALFACASDVSEPGQGPIDTASTTARPEAARPEAASPAPTTPSPTPTTPAPVEPADAHVLTLYAIPAPSSYLNPAGLSWQTPGGLVRRVLVNEAGGVALDFKRTIGHAGVRVACSASNGRPAEHFQGSMTNVDSGDFNALVIDQKVGLGMLFDNVPGRLEREEELQATVTEREGNGKMAFVEMHVSGDTCHALVDYAKAYAAANVQKNYGLAARPLYKEGAGCSAFSIAFLELANLLEPRFVQGWSFSVRVPKYTSPLIGSREALVGGSKNPGAEVPLTRLTTITRDWAKPTEEGWDLFGWDPTQMYEWIDAAAVAAQNSGSERVALHGQAKGLVLDRRTVAPKPELTNRTFFRAP